MTLQVLFVDNHLLAVAKPACLPTVPDSSGDESLFDMAREWVRVEFEKPGEAFLGVVHRLDRPVSGVVLFARTSKAARRLTAAFAAREVDKTYWAILERSPEHPRGRIEQWLVKDPERNRVRVAQPGSAGAKRALTSWRVLGEDVGRCLVELEPHTGRPHQLRSAMASLGHPILGDLKYGAPEPLVDRSIALHARRLAVQHPTLDSRPEFEASVPDLSVWDLARGG